MIPACSSRKSRVFYAGNLGKDAAPERRVRRAWRPLGHTPDASPTPHVDSPPSAITPHPASGYKPSKQGTLTSCGYNLNLNLCVRVRQNEAKNVNPFKERQHERVKPKFEEKVAKTANKTRPKPVVSKVVTARPKSIETTSAKPANSYQPTQLAGAVTVTPVSTRQLPRPRVASPKNTSIPARCCSRTFARRNGR